MVGRFTMCSLHGQRANKLKYVDGGRLDVVAPTRANNRYKTHEHENSAICGNISSTCYLFAIVMIVRHVCTIYHFLKTLDIWMRLISSTLQSNNIWRTEIHTQHASFTRFRLFFWCYCCRRPNVSVEDHIRNYARKPSSESKKIKTQPKLHNDNSHRNELHTLFLFGRHKRCLRAKPLDK